MDEDEFDLVVSRLDKQATAIKRLRSDRDKQAEQIGRLLARVEFLETVVNLGHVPEHPGPERQQVSGIPDTGHGQTDSEAIWRRPSIEAGAVPLVEQGNWITRAECLICGQVKQGKRPRMTCDGCSQCRRAAISGEIARPKFPECLNCGTTAKGGGGLQYLCLPCREGAKAAGC